MFQDVIKICSSCRKHLLEAKQEGLSEDIVPQMIQQSVEEVEDDLKKLTRQQAILLAELSKAYAEEDSKVRGQVLRWEVKG